MVRIKNKKIIGVFHAVAVIAAMGILTSCDDEKGLNYNPPTTEVGGVFESDNHGVTFTYEAFISGSIDGEMREALDECLVNKASAVGDATRLVVLNKLSDLDASSLEKAYLNGATIAIVKPRQADIDAFFANHPNWAGYSDDDDLDDCQLYSFDKDNCHFIITSENDPDCIAAPEPYKAPEESVDTSGEEKMAQIPDDHNDLYGYIGPWLEHLNRDEEKDASLSLKADSDTDQLEKFAKCSHYGKTYPFSVDQQVRKLFASSPDKIQGNGSITVSFDVYQVHVYEGESGAGDYYIVNMCASVANDDMFKGKWWNQHGGCYVRITGFYGKGFTISSQLVDANGSAVANLSFPASAAPSPATTIGQTQYTNSTTLNLSGSTSLSVGAGMSATGPSVNATRSFDMSMGWSWTKSESRTVSDVDISNKWKADTTHWDLIFNNLPYFDWDEDYGFNLGKSQVYRSTQEIRGSWAWYEKDAKDDVDKDPYYIKFTAWADYGSMDFLTTKADLQTHDWTFGKVSDMFKLEKMANGRAGIMILNNDFTDQYISNIKVYNPDKTDEIYYENKNSFEPGTQVDLGAYMIKDKYMVSFSANKAGLPSKNYIYTLNTSVPLYFKGTTTLNAKNDFSIQ